MKNEILNQNIDENEGISLQNTMKVKRSTKTKRVSGQNNNEKREKTNHDDILANVILPSVPPESKITSAKFEGPNISLYTLNPKFSLTELTYYLSSLSRSLKKRFTIKTDPSIRLSEEETRTAILKVLPGGVSISAIFCDDATGEVVLEVNHPELITPDMIISIAENTGWIAHTLRSPHIPSSIINLIHSTLKGSARERSLFLQSLGKRIFRQPLIIKNEAEDSSNGTRKLSSNDQSGGIRSRPRSKEEISLFCLGGAVYVLAQVLNEVSLVS